MSIGSEKQKERISSSQALSPKVVIVPNNVIGMSGIETIASGDERSSAIIYKKVTDHYPEREIFAKSASLSIVCKGTKRITAYDGDSFELKENEAVFLPPDLYMVSELLPSKVGGGFESFVFFFPEGLIEEFLKTRKIRLASGKVGDLFRLPYGTTLRVYAENLKPLFASLGEKGEGLIRIKLLEALQIFASSDKTGKFPDWLFRVSQDSYRGRRRDIEEFMEKNFDKLLGVEDYATLTGRSISSFQRDFKRIYGTSPRKWLTMRRLQKAKTLLEQGQTNVTDVAFALGYENISHFIRAFQERYGVTPGELLKRRSLVI